MLNLLLVISEEASVTMQIISLVTGLISFTITIINLIILWSKLIKHTICTNRRRIKLEKRLLEQIRHLEPDYILAPSRNGIFIAEEIVQKWGKHIPIIPILLHNRDLVANPTPTMLRTSKFLIEMPAVSFTNNQRVLIIDDVIITGETIIAITEELKKHGVNQRVFTAALVVDSSCHKSKSIPDKYAWQNDIRNYRFAWRD